MYTFSNSICLLLHIESGALYWQSREETQIVSEQYIYIQFHILWNIQFPMTFNRTDKRMEHWNFHIEHHIEDFKASDR